MLIELVNSVRLIVTSVILRTKTTPVVDDIVVSTVEMKSTRKPSATAATCDAVIPFIFCNINRGKKSRKIDQKQEVRIVCMTTIE